jgi:hypothetical protein
MISAKSSDAAVTMSKAVGGLAVSGNEMLDLTVFLLYRSPIFIGR